MGQVFIGVIEHRHGRNTYASLDREKVMDAIQRYCLEWWGDEKVPGEPDTDIVSRYFAHVEEEEYTMWAEELL